MKKSIFPKEKMSAYITEDGSHYEQSISTIGGVFEYLKLPELKVNIALYRETINKLVEETGKLVLSANIDEGYLTRNRQYMIRMYRLIASISIVNLYKAYLLGEMNDELARRVLVSFYHVLYYSSLK